MRGRFPLAAALLAAAVVVSSAARSAACAPCGSGDTTLTTIGSEQPFLGRLRSAMDVRYRTDAVGTPGVDRTRIRELRADVSLAWAARDDLFLLASLPLVWRSVSEATLARSELRSVGDAELSARWFVWRDRAFAPRWLAAVLGGVKLPTAPRHEAAGAAPLPLEAQPGSGSLDATAGASLAFFAAPLSLYASVQLREPLLARRELEPGRSALASAAVQAQLGEPFAARALCDLRWDAASREGGVRAPHSGGVIGYVGLELLWSPLLDVSLVPGARLPALQRLRGSHEEGAIVSLALIRDW